MESKCMRSDVFLRGAKWYAQPDLAELKRKEM